jgi:hypothetical protein
MSLPIERVELGFDENGPGNFFILDDAVQGVLDNTAYVLGGGSFFYDVSAYVQEISVQRGKSRALDRYSSGQARVTFNNRNRYFDPTYLASPFYGQIVPRRDVRIWSNNQIVYVGTTDDWDLNYAPNGDSVAVLSAYDGFAFLSQQTLTAATNPVELSGARVNRILDDPGVAWPTGARAVSAGDETLQGDTVELGANALEYLQTIESTEPGELFIGKSGNLTFQARNAVAPSSAAVVLSDDATGVRYSSVRVVYGSELLFTQTELQRQNSVVTIQTNDTAAQSDYGIRTLSINNLLSETDLDVAELGNWLLGQYAAPEYRFDGVEVLMSQLTTLEQDSLLGLELGSVCKITFTPNGIPPAIVKFARVISITHQATLTEHRMIIGLGTLTTNTFVLDDPAFGILDTGILAF